MLPLIPLKIDVYLFQLSKDLETEQQLNISLRQGKQEWVSKVVDLQTAIEQKDQVNIIPVFEVLLGWQ